MQYTFEILGVSPILHFFNHQQEILQHKRHHAAEYLGAYRCTLDALIQTVETVPPEREWNLDQVVDSVINFWLNNSENVQRWKKRLEDAGNENLLITRVADMKSLKTEFESLLNQSN